jgi:hypothetical protein
MFDAVKRLLLRESQMQTLLVLFEDALPPRLHERRILSRN